jgi:hypothetical protein
VGELYHSGAEPSRSFSDDTAEQLLSCIILERSDCLALLFQSGAVEERLPSFINSELSRGGALAMILSGCAVPGFWSSS